ncbi:MAG: glycoside hydrolase family 2 protein [Chitinophagaceae bacterium]|nr:glycoside hydrolase family 2 protein [Chitinophagaceae bacterium]
MIKRIFLTGLFFLVCQTAFLQVRSTVDFNNGWKFYSGNDSLASNVNYNDSKWRSLSLPHDWSIESNFSAIHPSGNLGGALPGGIGWYRKTFTVPAESKNKNIRIEFDGVYKNSEVWINGHFLGKRPNGYISFSYDLTPYLNYGKTNVIAVKVDNSQQPDSRWYSGSGIYRDVKLIVVNPDLFIKDTSHFITTSDITTKRAKVTIAMELSSSEKSDIPVSFFTNIYDQNGKLVKTAEILGREKHISISNSERVQYSVIISNPFLWSVSNPYLYKAVTKVFRSGVQTDELTTTFGIRSFRFDSEKGFFLNNKPLKIQGVCMHHDLGALGAAFNKTAAKRQLTILKEMGCNAIRFSHNPPASEMLNLCDEMGFLVMVEAFDMWKRKKNKFDYHLEFEEWHERDLQAMILRDRNHPSVFMWSIGNEIGEQFDSTGTVIAKRLVDIVKALDTTRPVTSALTETFAEKNFITKAGRLAVLGFNYKEYDYAELPKRFPGQKFLATETASALETRGVYQYPGDSVRIWPPNFKEQKNFTGGNADFTCAAYDNTFAYWGNTHEKSWLAVKNNPHIAGLFVWSGFDYLGEPTPYPYPARSSYFGVIDLAGFPKDVYYMYQSEWGTKPVLHLFPHWNWQVGTTVDVWAYYNNADEVELFLNGKSLGVKKKENNSFHVMWRVQFEPGVLKAVSRKKGKIVLSKEMKTAGKAAKIELIADRKNLKANGKDLSFIKVRILDKDGIPVPDADNLLEFSVAGAGTIAGTDNGFQADTVSLKTKQRKAWKGLALVIVQSAQKQGNITVIAKSAGLKETRLSLKTGE